MTAIDKLLADDRISRGGAADPAQVAEAERELGVELPDDYKALQLRYDGVEGPVGDSDYLVVWPIEELTSLNREYAVEEFAPGIVLFGSDGGDTGYGFDRRSPSMSVVEVPLIGMDLHAVRPVSDTFSGFLERLTQEETGNSA